MLNKDNIFGFQAFGYSQLLSPLLSKAVCVHNQYSIITVWMRTPLNYYKHYSESSYLRYSLLAMEETSNTPFVAKEGVHFQKLRSHKTKDKWLFLCLLPSCSNSQTTWCRRERFDAHLLKHEVPFWCQFPDKFPQGRKGKLDTKNPSHTVSLEEKTVRVKTHNWILSLALAKEEGSKID